MLAGPPSRGTVRAHRESAGGATDGTPEPPSRRYRRRPPRPSRTHSWCRAVPRALGLPSPPGVVLQNGLRLVFDRRPGTGVVAIELFADAGIVREAKPGLAALTGRLLEEGTADPRRRVHRADDRGRRRLARGRGRPGPRSASGPRTWPWRLDLLPTSVRRPAFPAEAIARVSRRMAAELRGDLDDPAFRTELSFRGWSTVASAGPRDPRGGVG